MEVLVEVEQAERSTLWVMVREPLDIGRECDGLILDDPKVSRRHAQLQVDDVGLRVTDLGSTNGTLVNGTLIAQETRVGPADEISVGGATIRVDAKWHAAQTAASATKATTTATTTRGTVVAGGAAAFAAMTPTQAANEAPSRRTSIDIVADAVGESDMPDVAELVNDEGTLTIVFSDIESSTEMASRVGDGQWMNVLHAHNSIIRTQVEAYGGREIKSQGDGFMLSFPSARRALISMMRVQQEITAHAAANPETGVRVRIGLHTGEVILTDDGDLFGRHVIMAARIAGQATGGQILVSGLVRQITEGGGDLPYGEAMPTQLKGLGDQTYDMVEVKWWEYTF